MVNPRSDYVLVKLPIEWHMQFKLATLTFKALHAACRPSCLSDLVQRHSPTMFLRSFSSYQLSVPRHNLTFGSRAFRFSAPRVWNSLPVSIRESSVTSYFQMSFKDFFLSVILPPFSYPSCLYPLYLCPCALILLRLWHYMNHVLTYLLIYLHLILTEPKVKLITMYFCSEQDKQLTIPDDLGKDGQSVAALQRRLANFEHDLLNLGTQVCHCPVAYL